MTTFYDQEMRAMVEQTMDYLMSERGQAELRKAAQESKALADKFRKAREIPWELLHRPFNI